MHTPHLLKDWFKDTLYNVQGFLFSEYTNKLQKYTNKLICSKHFGRYF
jgi:hypothetical protein